MGAITTRLLNVISGVIKGASSFLFESISFFDAKISAAGQGGTVTKKGLFCNFTGYGTERVTPAF
jgi:hypothetical protein